MKNSNQLFNTQSEEITSVYEDQTLWSIFLAVLFLGIVLTLSERIYFLNYILGSSWILGVSILVFAIFRLTKMLISDSIFQWLRDLFLVVKIEKTEQATKIHRSMPEHGFARQIVLLLDCPWCVSVWISLASVYLWFIHPVSRIFFFIMALSGFSTLIYIGVKNLQILLERK